MSYQNMNVPKLAKQIHQTAVEKGWWDTKRNKDEMHMLDITELAEAVESDREGNWANIKEFSQIVSDNYSNGELPEDQWKSMFEVEIKDTVEDEIADCYIRCLDYLYWKHRDAIILGNLADHDWSDNFAENIFFICKQITDRRIEDAVIYITQFCKHMDINLNWHVKHKMRYNGMRPKMHGNKKY